MEGDSSVHMGRRDGKPGGKQKLYGALMEIGSKIDKEKWIVIGDLNRHIGFNKAPVKTYQILQRRLVYE